MAKNLSNWTIVEFGSLDIPKQADFEKAKTFYTILTKKGQILTAYPKYPNEDDICQIPRWHAPSIGDIFSGDVIAFAPIDIPRTLIQSLKEEPLNKNKAFAYIFNKNPRKLSKAGELA